MTQLTFPSNPSIGQLYSAPNGFIYEFSGNKWSAKSGRPTTNTGTVTNASVVIVPSSNLDNRPVGVVGEIWFDTSLQRFEGYTGTAWVPLNETILAGPQGPTGPVGPRGSYGPVGPAGPGVPIGGTAGQILSKVSNTNFDTSWTTVVNPPTVSVERYTFTSSLTWTVVHNKNTRKVIETLTDINGSRFYAGINIVDANSFEVVLADATAGTIDVIFG
jgi:hypothetical protein